MGTTGQAITLANSIIGVGILAMPFCFQQCGVVLATLILLLMGLVSRLSSYFLLKSALIARRRNFEFLAFHVFGPAGKFAIEVGIIGFLMGTCIAYFVVVGDLGPQIIAKIFNINQSDILRTSIMVIVSLVCVLPLGLLRNVDSLSNVSAATIGFYLCLVMKVIAEAATQLWNGDWQSKVELWKPSGVLQCVPIFSMALFCQTQLFEIFESLPTISLEKMNVVTKMAINICTSVYFTLGVFGYIAFCTQTISGNILVSLSPTMASDVIKLGFVMSLAFSFPLIIFPCRASLYSLMYKKAHTSHHDNVINHSIPEGTFRLITVSIIAVALVVSLMIPNIELVLGLVGSTIGVLVCVVFPSACFIRITFKNTNERVLAKVILILGLFILVLGTFANLQAAENKLERYDDKYITQERIDKIVEDFFESKKLEKSEDILKPIQEPEKNINDENSDYIKESEIQPPNPVPPESQSKEKIDQPPVETKENVKLKEDLAKVKEISIEFESHPRNLINKLNDTKHPNGVNKDKSNEMKKDKPSSDQDKLNIMKQQQLIETIKQHGEEQKELIKEQKEILDEIKKTKEELKQEKKEKIDSKEAKKLAVERIQKIANMAIQSLSDVTEAPVKKEIKIPNINKENYEKIANEAVQQIAKNAIEALKESKEKIKQSENVISAKKLEDANVINNNVVPQNSNNIPSVHLNNAPPSPIIKENNLNPGQLVNQVNNIIHNNIQMQEHSVHMPDEPQSNYRKTDQIANPGVKANAINNINQNVPLESQNNLNSQAIKQNGNQLPQGINANKNVPSNDNILNVQHDLKTLVNKNNPQINGVPHNNMRNLKDTQDNIVKTDNIVRPEIVPGQDLPVNQRQKREVVDCTDKTILKPEDRQICDMLVINKNIVDIPKVSDDFLPSVDLEKELIRKLPMDNVVPHRSLKSIDEDNNNR